MDAILFKAIFKEHYQPLSNMAFRILNDFAKAEDVVQDVFVKVWYDDISFDDHTKTLGYLYTMVKNRSYEIIRLESKEKNIVQNASYINKLPSVEIDEIEKWSLLNSVYAHIRQMPPKTAEVFTEAKINGLSYAQIAAKLDISLKTVEAHVTKAYKMLRKDLNEQKIKVFNT